MKFLVLMVVLQVSVSGAIPVNETKFAEVSIDRIALVEPVSVIFTEFASFILKSTILFEN